MSFSVRIFEIAYVKEAPGPQIFWMSEWKKKFRLSFQIMLIRGKGKNILVNTGLTEEMLDEINKIWTEENGENSKLVLSKNIGTVLKDVNLKPEDIDFVLITPLQHYAMGNIDIFKNAKICISKRGWLDFHAPKYQNELRKHAIPPRILNYLIFEGWENVKLLEDEDVILPGLSTFWCGCHHRSSIAIKIETNNGIVIASDCFFSLENIKNSIPIGICENIYECFDAYLRINKEADIIISLYDSNNFTRFNNGMINIH